eukprot:TRINITY_DN2815_c0_g1_i4.p1 TRINITY_DN2815_c0_g1~~TRINITY_DN2815_c0_g1_i4.p1  ORF type:complete len:314 (+),score=80.21 TRINITY_DN2815_c0_g1_i4:129-1070(+)
MEAAQPVKVGQQSEGDQYIVRVRSLGEADRPAPMKAKLKLKFGSGLKAAPKRVVLNQLIDESAARITFTFRLTNPAEGVAREKELNDLLSKALIVGKSLNKQIKEYSTKFRWKTALDSDRLHLAISLDQEILAEFTPLLSAFSQTLDNVQAQDAQIDLRFATREKLKTIPEETSQCVEHLIAAALENMNFVARVRTEYKEDLPKLARACGLQDEMLVNALLALRGAELNVKVDGPIIRGFVTQYIPPLPTQLDVEPIVKIPIIKKIYVFLRDALMPEVKIRAQPEDRITVIAAFRCEPLSALFSILTNVNRQL